MPTYRSITIALISQFEGQLIPEFAPPVAPNDPFSNSPTLISPDQSLVSVYVPSYPRSQFWLQYSISPPRPPKQFFYFKLFINGRPIVSWGCGEDDGYEGKTMFGLFGSKESLIERRVFCFGPDTEDPHKLQANDHGNFMEVKVFRSKGRKRMIPEVQEYDTLPAKSKIKSKQKKSENSINLIKAGLIPPKHPQRYYKYALLDPLDQPFATFHYYCRSWDQLEILGAIPLNAATGASSIISEHPSNHPLSPKASSTTVETCASVKSYLDYADGPSVNSFKDSPSGDKVNQREAQEDTPVSTIADTESTISAQDQDLTSPLRAKITSPPTLTRPSTPPSTVTPSKPPQHHEILGPINPLLIKQASKESFASLIQSYIPETNPDTFQLQDLRKEAPRPPSPLRRRSDSSINTIKRVVDHVKKARGSYEELLTPPEDSGSAETFKSNGSRTGDGRSSENGGWDSQDSQKQTIETEFSSASQNLHENQNIVKLKENVLDRGSIGSSDPPSMASAEPASTPSKHKERNDRLLNGSLASSGSPNSDTSTPLSKKEKKAQIKAWKEQEKRELKERQKLQTTINLQTFLDETRM